MNKLKNVDHPFIIKYVESFDLPNDEENQRKCFVMELADGLDL